jgi:hypothetical protein
VDVVQHCSILISIMKSIHLSLLTIIAVSLAWDISTLDHHRVSRVLASSSRQKGVARVGSGSDVKEKPVFHELVHSTDAHSHRSDKSDSNLSSDFWTANGSDAFQSEALSHEDDWDDMSEVTFMSWRVHIHRVWYRHPWKGRDQSLTWKARPGR